MRAHDQLCGRLGAELLAMTSGDAIMAEGLGWGHRDPFDRMLVAQTLRSRSTLITRDPIFGALAGLAVRWCAFSTPIPRRRRVARGLASSRPKAPCGGQHRVAVGNDAPFVDDPDDPAGDEYLKLWGHSSERYIASVLQ